VLKSLFDRKQHLMLSFAKYDIDDGNYKVSSDISV